MTKLRVTTRKDGFRRAGRAWHGVTEIDSATLTPAQIAALKAEPMLLVEEISPPEPEPTAEPGKPKTRAKAPGEA
jgi:hypothetical protein